MIDTSWRIEDPDPEESSVGSTASGFVSLHFLRSALRRRWPVWVAAAVAGMLLGIAWTLAVPTKGQGTVTLMLAHDSGTDPAVAMATDVSLLRTRTVAQDVIDDLGLDMTPEVFQKTVAVTPVTSSVLQIDVAGPDDASAVARAEALSEAYLTFRGTQMKSQAQALVDGYQRQVDNLNHQVDTLTDQYKNLTAQGAEGQSQASEVLTQRSQAYGEISRIQQVMEDTSLQSDSIVKASHVLDDPSAVPQSGLKRIVINTMAGLILGLSMGVGLVLFQALTSGRLRRRDEVALALATPVRFSAGRISGPRKWRPAVRRSPPEQGLEVLAQGLETALSASKGRQARLALVAVDDIPDSALVIARLAAHLADSGKAVFLVDLTASGPLEAAVTKALAGDQQGPRSVEPEIFRPEGPPAFALGPVGAAPHAHTELSKGDPRRAAWSSADVVLTLAEVDPAVGVDHLTSWVDRVVLLVSAGRSSAERLRTAGELVRSAGLQLVFAMMCDADRTDESSGRRDPLAPGWTGNGSGSR
jgi:capsular polysaccharide biosynthesis protein